MPVTTCCPVCSQNFTQWNEAVVAYGQYFGADIGQQLVQPFAPAFNWITNSVPKPSVPRAALPTLGRQPLNPSIPVGQQLGQQPIYGEDFESSPGNSFGGSYEGSSAREPSPQVLEAADFPPSLPSRERRNMPSKFVDEESFNILPPSNNPQK